MVESVIEQHYADQIAEIVIHRLHQQQSHCRPQHENQRPEPLAQNVTIDQRHQADSSSIPFVGSAGCIVHPVNPYSAEIKGLSRLRKANGKYTNGNTPKVANM